MIAVMQQSSEQHLWTVHCSDVHLHLHLHLHLASLNFWQFSSLELFAAIEPAYVEFGLSASFLLATTPPAYLPQTDCGPSDVADHAACMEAEVEVKVGFTLGPFEGPSVILQVA